MHLLLEHISKGNSEATFLRSRHKCDDDEDDDLPIEFGHGHHFKLLVLVLAHMHPYMPNKTNILLTFVCKLKSKKV